MPALESGTVAPAFTLPTTHGDQFSLEEALQRGWVVAAFYKITCPVCQLTFPYLERVYKAYPRENVSFVGISQDEEDYTEDFAREYGVTFPMLLDDTDTYPVSNAYELTNVPTIFVIAPDGEIKLTSIGWDPREIEQLNTLVAKAAGVTRQPVFRTGEDVPPAKAG
jgi:peroxiredoxin